MQLFYALRAEHAKIFLLARTWPPSLLVQCHRDADRTVKRQMRKVVPNSAETVFQGLLNTDTWPLIEGPRVHVKSRHYDRNVGVL